MKRPLLIIKTVSVARGLGLPNGRAMFDGRPFPPLKLFDAGLGWPRLASFPLTGWAGRFRQAAWGRVSVSAVPPRPAWRQHNASNGGAAGLGRARVTNGGESRHRGVQLSRHFASVNGSRGGASETGDAIWRLCWRLSSPCYTLGGGASIHPLLAASAPSTPPPVPALGIPAMRLVRQCGGGG